MSLNKYNLEAIVDEFAQAYVAKASSLGVMPEYDELTASQKFQIKQPLLTSLNMLLPIAEKHMTEVIKKEVVDQLRESIKAAEAMGLRAEDAIAVF